MKIMFTYQKKFRRKFKYLSSLINKRIITNTHYSLERLKMIPMNAVTSEKIWN